MPEGLVKIHSNLYRTMAPAVFQQVSSQLRVRDFSKANVTFAPTGAPSWSAAKTQIGKARSDMIKQGA